MFPDMNPEAICSEVIRYQISHLTLVPSAIHQLVHHPKTSKTDFSSVVSVACGAAYLPPELKEKFDSLAPAGVRFVEGVFSLNHL